MANMESGDTLSFGAADVDLNSNGATGPDANGFTYTVSSAGTSPVVTITHAGTDDATVNSMLNSLLFNNASNNDPSTTVRTVTLTSVTDSDSGTTADGTIATVSVAKADDAININTTGKTVNFTEDAGATSSLFAAGIDTIETGDTISQLVLTLANVESGDTLSFGATNVDLNTNGATGPDANGFTYTVSSAGSTPVVTISHAGTDDATVNTMLNSLVFNNTSNNDPSTTARTVTLTSVTDSGSGTTADGTVATVNVAKADDAININTSGNTVSFTEDAGATTALFSAGIDTIETGDTISQVILTLTNVESGDTLNFAATDVDLNNNGATGPDGNGFTYTVSSAGSTPVVTITHAGTDDATVNSMLNSLLFNNTSNNDPSTTARTVTLTSVTDSGSGTTADGTVATVNVAKADDSINISITDNTVSFPEAVVETGVEENTVEKEVDQEISPKSTSDADKTPADAESGLGLSTLVGETVELPPIDAAVLASVVADTPRDSGPNEYQSVTDKPIPPKFIDLENLDIAPFELESQEPVQLRSLMDNAAFIEGLDAMNRDLDKALEDSNARHRLGMEMVVGVTMSLSAGFVSWVLKTGSLMASFMSILPLWKQFDPLPILGAAMIKKRKERAKQKIGKDEEDAKVEELFKKEGSD